MTYLFTSESVSEGHPDKVSDQISDAILDEFLKNDPESKVACETFVTTGLVLIGGEVRTRGYVEFQDIPRRVIRKIGYTKSEYQFDADSCGVMSTIHDQSDDIHMGVVREKDEDQGAGDQGMMFGYACKEMENYMPVPIELSHMLVQELAAIRKEGKRMKYLRPDSKSQVTVEYSDTNRPQRIHTIVISTQHDAFESEEQMRETITKDVKRYLIPKVKKQLPSRIKRLFKEEMILHINPTGNFVIGGPHGDTGLTGRKIIVDTYGGRGAHGGGAFSGKDSSKVDRSAAYAARHMAKNMVAAGVADEVLVQVAYAIGVAQPVSLHIDTNGTAKVRNADGKKMKDGEIAEIIKGIFDMRPNAIINRFGLTFPVFKPTAAYGHFGRDAYEEEIELFYDTKDKSTIGIHEHKAYKKKVKFFAWEELDYVDQVKKAFKL
jgi:S-adenosylmethionine synthetase